MKKEILKIADELKSNKITSKKAQKQLLCLFCVIKQVCSKNELYQCQYRSRICVLNDSCEFQKKQTCL